jgi:hypothetical protein
MKQTINIDLSTVKVNENYGSTQTVVRTKVEYEISGEGRIPDCLNYNNFRLTEQTHCWGGINGSWRGFIVDESNDILKKLSQNQTIVVRQNVYTDTMNHPPVPKYSFKYENTDITCDECKQTFKSFDFVESDDFYSSTCCKFCANHIDVKYQKIHDIEHLLTDK